MRKQLERESVYQHIRDDITYGIMSPGEQIFEAAVAKKFSMSRTPVREAIRQLQMEGYITVVPNSGAFVSKISPQDIKEIYEIVALLEGYGVQLATQKVTLKEIKELKNLHQEVNAAAKKDDVRRYNQYNIRLHMSLIQASGNENLVTTIRSLRNRIYRTHYIGITIPGHYEEYIEDHREILDAMSKKDSVKARSLMENHIQRTKNILINYLEKNEKFKKSP